MSPRSSKSKQKNIRSALIETQLSFPHWRPLEWSQIEKQKTNSSNRNPTGVTSGKAWWSHPNRRFQQVRARSKFRHRRSGTVAERFPDAFLCELTTDGSLLNKPPKSSTTPSSLKAMTQQIREDLQLRITDTIRRSRNDMRCYQSPVKRPASSGFDTRTVHPFASSHYRKPLCIPI